MKNFKILIIVLTLVLTTTILNAGPIFGSSTVSTTCCKGAYMYTYTTTTTYIFWVPITTKGEPINHGMANADGSDCVPQCSGGGLSGTTASDPVLSTN